MKTCSKCNTEKELTEFNKNAATPSGLQAYCRNCSNKNNKHHHVTNKDEINERHRRHYKNNIKKERVRCATYHKNNPEKLKNRSKRWRKENPEKYAMQNKLSASKYRAQKVQAVPQWFDKKEVEYIYSLASERNLEVDHIVPLNSDKVCGLHVQDNLRCIPAALNASKGNRYWPQMWKQEEIAYGR